MNDDKIEDYPESPGADRANVAAQAGLGFVPMVGGALAPVVAAMISAPLEKRRTKWFNRLGEGLRDLEEKFDGFDPATLADNEDFVSAVYETTDAAMKANTEGKRERLANVVLNIAAGRTLADALRGRFLGHVQAFSEEHILLLRLCDDPLSFPRVAARENQISAGAKSAIFEEEFRAHGVNPDVIAVAAQDLTNAGMTEGGLNVMMSAQGLFSSSTTRIGKAFLHFISNPIDQ